MELNHHKKACRAVQFSADGLCKFLQICLNVFSCLKAQFSLLIEKTY
jgi:hypothetical protein